MRKVSERLFISALRKAVTIHEELIANRVGMASTELWQFLFLWSMICTLSRQARRLKGPREYFPLNRQVKPKVAQIDILLSRH
jgi:hypothetical protein